MPQSSVVWMADCSSAPHIHFSVSSVPQQYMHITKWPTPVLSLFSATNRLRGKLWARRKANGRVTRNWVGGLALHGSRRLKPEFSSATAWRWKGRRECRLCVPRKCTLWTRVWRGWLVFSCAWSASLKVERSHRRWAGGMPVSRHGAITAQM